MLGRVVSHYRILGTLGGGGMGVVYRAEDIRLGRPVALKFLPPSWGSDSTARERFLQEARAAATLDHSRICTIHEIDETPEGELFIAMALYEGTTVRELVDRAPLPVDQAVGIAIQTAEGLRAAHSRAIVHRDIKPANLLVTTAGEVKILDFGLAKPAGASNLTRSGTVVGTAKYMSPEQAQGHALDHRTDIWSLGVVLYEMLTGRTPFEGESDVAVLLAAINTEPAPVTELRSDTPLALLRIIERALAKDPADRYATVEEMLDDLRALVSASWDTGLTGLAGPGGEAVSAGLGSRPGAVPSGSRRLALVSTAAALLILVAAALLWWRTLPAPRPDEQPTATRPRVVVLPFENLGAAADQPFAAGITEELTSRLAMVSGLAVISRTTAVGYDRTGRTVPEIGADLGVDYLLEGSVRSETDRGDRGRVRVTCQLIRIADDTHLWSQSYDRVLGDVFALQSEIAIQVAAELDVTLLGAERDGLDRRPTTSPAAYETYLRGVDIFRAMPALDQEYQAISALERAVELDPGFALAHAELARIHAHLIHVGYDRSERRYRLAREAAERALELAPHTAEAHLAMGYYHYWVHKDYDSALAELALAELAMPSSSEVVEAEGLVLRRMGRVDEALDKLERALQLSPRNPAVAYMVGSTHAMLRRYPEAVAAFDQSIANAPQQMASYLHKVLVLWLWRGDVDTSRAIFDTMPRSSDSHYILFQFYQLFYEGDLGAALDWLSVSRIRAIVTEDAYYPATLLEAQVRRLQGDETGARDAFGSARSELEQALADSPDDPRLHMALGLALAGLGEQEAALRESARGIPVAANALVGPYHMVDRALTLTMLDRTAEACQVLAEVLAIPAEFSPQMVRLDPRWVSLRDDPTCQSLLAAADND